MLYAYLICLWVAFIWEDPALVIKLKKKTINHSKELIKPRGADGRIPTIYSIALKFKICMLLGRVGSCQDFLNYFGKDEGWVYPSGQSAVYCCPSNK